ncbi:MAG: hypothetical protein FIA96_14330 [Betaproteobacteria bacterium]|nr:hypothetical protein [Betaproteobacteria bacterium]
MLYFAAFRVDSEDTDKVLIFHGRTAACLEQIDLDQVGQPRSFAQTLLFGPKGRLFVPINDAGEIRRYNVKTKAYDVFFPAAAAGGPLLNPWFLSFGEPTRRRWGMRTEVGR